MMPGNSAPSLARAISSLAEAETDLMALKRGATVGEAEAIERAMRAIETAAYEVRKVREAREGLRW